ELSRIAEGDRARLAQIIELAPFSVLVLRGRNLLVEQFNSRIAWLFAGHEVLGRPIDDVAEFFQDSGPPIADLARALYLQDVEQSTAPIARSSSGEQGEPAQRALVYRLLPLHDLAGKVDGVVIYSLEEHE